MSKPSDNREKLKILEELHQVHTELIDLMERKINCMPISSDEFLGVEYSELKVQINKLRTKYIKICAKQ